MSVLPRKGKSRQDTNKIVLPIPGLLRDEEKRQEHPEVQIFLLIPWILPTSCHFMWTCPCCGIGAEASREGRSSATFAPENCFVHSTMPLDHRRLGKARESIWMPFRSRCAFSMVQLFLLWHHRQAPVDLCICMTHIHINYM